MERQTLKKSVNPAHKNMWQGIFPATVFSFQFLQVWCHHRDYYSLFNLSDQLHFLQISSFVVRSFSPYPGENDLRRKRNEKYWLSVGYVLIRCFLFQERTVKTIKWWRRNGESKNISSRPKRLKKFMQTRIKTKKTPENPTLTLLYTIFHEKGTPFIYLLSVTNGAPSTYLV